MAGIFLGCCELLLSGSPHFCGKPFGCFQMGSGKPGILAPLSRYTYIIAHKLALSI
ncbi:hypothetical protein CLOLEP_01644 [[Clostridium] leptum DSM 753]|uniref:Uncharacterized protein n=1 Tax=[Clostridium] leptum DSM 753 TaxID=428125 RepID=A7VSV3_9FIRM|nr:hypothetical protein CLOLEP_01644 [[Clostridium] leptum DSM 753]